MNIDCTGREEEKDRRRNKSQKVAVSCHPFKDFNQYKQLKTGTFYCLNKFRHKESAASVNSDIVMVS